MAAVLTVVVCHVGSGADPGPAVQPAVTHTRSTYSVSGAVDPWATSTPQLPGVASDDSALVGAMTNHLEFARRVATVLLAYDAGTDFLRKLGRRPASITVITKTRRQWAGPAR